MEDAANEEHRPVADVVRELVETGLGERLWKAHTENEFPAGEIGLPDDDQPMTDEYRQTLRVRHRGLPPRARASLWTVMPYSPASRRR